MKNGKNEIKPSAFDDVEHAKDYPFNGREVTIKVIDKEAKLERSIKRALNGFDIYRNQKVESVEPKVINKITTAMYAFTYIKFDNIPTDPIVITIQEATTRKGIHKFKYDTEISGKVYEFVAYDLADHIFNEAPNEDQINFDWMGNIDYDPAQYEELSCPGLEEEYVLLLNHKSNDENENSAFLELDERTIEIYNRK